MRGEVSGQRSPHDRDADAALCTASTMSSRSQRRMSRSRRVGRRGRCESTGATAAKSSSSRFEPDACVFSWGSSEGGDPQALARRRDENVGRSVVRLRVRHCFHSGRNAMTRRRRLVELLAYEVRARSVPTCRPRARGRAPASAAMRFSKPCCCTIREGEVVRVGTDAQSGAAAIRSAATRQDESAHHSDAYGRAKT